MKTRAALIAATACAVMLEPGTNWAPLALVDGNLFIRDQKQLKCVKVAQ
jgi:hypothetical protein